MIIKFCFNLAAKLSAYKDLGYHSITGSGPFLLASLNTDDFKNYTKATRGLNLDVTNHLQENFLFFRNWKVYYNTFAQNENPRRCSLG